MRACEPIHSVSLGDRTRVNCGIVSIPLPGLPLGVTPDALGGRPLALAEFLAGPENHLADAAVRAVLDEVIGKYNPLLFCGPSGTGKSHLALGLAHVWRVRRGRRGVETIAAADFARELGDAIAAQATEDFRTKYREAALLVIEDVGQLAGRDAAQEELLHTFDALLANGGRLIATAVGAPHGFRDFLPTLASRLESGLVVPLHLPGREVRREVLDRLAALCAVSAPGAVLELLAAELDAPVPELLGALLQLHAPAQMEGEPIGLAQARRWLGDRNGTRRPAIREIAMAVSKQFGVRLPVLRGPLRQRGVVVARDAAIYLAREISALSFVEIGRYFGGRDHTTVLHGYRKMQQLLSTDAALRQTVETVQKALQPC